MTRRTSTLAPCLFALALAIPAQAWALDQGDHRELAEQTCKRVGLPQSFCFRVGNEVYNVDHDEWDDMAAHAQPEAGQDLCVAAEAAADRVGELAYEMNFWMHQPATNARTTKLASLLGRSLHTIQDNCAHSGMSNIQHAWLSRIDTCEGGHTSPDVQLEAVECAESETSLAIEAFAAALRRYDVAFNTIQGVDPSSGVWPPREGVCEFLDGAKDWDGIDRGWNNTVVVRALRERFISGLAGNDLTRSVCGGATAAEALFKIASAPVDTSGSPPTCKRIAAYCLGKGDESEATSPPWGHEDAEEVTEAGGCASTGSGASLAWGLLLVAIVGFRRTRRRVITL